MLFWRTLTCICRITKYHVFKFLFKYSSTSGRVFVGGDPETKISVRHLQCIPIHVKQAGSDSPTAQHCHMRFISKFQFSFLTSRVDKLLPSTLCTLRWKHYCLLEIFYDKLKSASSVSLRSGCLWLHTYYTTNNQAWPILISIAKMQNCTLTLDWGEECQVSGNFSVLRHLTCRGELCNHYRQVSIQYIPVMTSQWETQQQKHGKYSSQIFPTYF